MVTKVYVSEPTFALANPDASQAGLCYTILVWEEGFPPVYHAPCSQETFITFDFGEGWASIRQKVVDNIVAFIGVSSNDIIFLGAWV